MIKIVTDTAVSLPPNVIRDHDITLLGGHIHFGDEKYADYFEMTADDFYRRLAESSVHPATTDPSPEAFRVIYRSLNQRFPEAQILSIHCTSRMAQTMDSARVAAASFPDVAIRLFDTLSVAAAQGLMVWEAARMAADGEPMAAILGQLAVMRDQTRVYFTLDTLEFLARSGRVGPIERLVGDLLDIKPVLTFREGMATFHGQQRTRPKALAALRDLALAECMGHSGLRMGVMHAACEDDAQELADDLARLLKPEVMLVSPLGAGVGANAGPGALGVSWHVPRGVEKPA